MSGKQPTQTYQDEYPSKIGFEYLRNKLKIKNIEAKEALKRKHPHVDKFFKEKGLDLGAIREHSARIIGAGALTGTLLISPPTGIGSLPAPQEIADSIKGIVGAETSDATQKLLVSSIKGVLPEKVRPLTRDEEKALEQIFSSITGVPTKATLEGEHLNSTYGLIGLEQHLRRYPGDFVDYQAPGLGAWGYFAPSKAQLTPDLVETEKWYAVVQTLYLPDWNKRQPYLRDWYKYRKVLIVNTLNGNAVVAAIADSGPAAWTGKIFGGSPEVMDYLGGPKYTKGPVVLFFVDDPENKVPLGPVEYNKQSLLLRSKINISEAALKQI